MGNRAVVFFESADTGLDKYDRYAGVYLHWNGSPGSVYAFLEYMKEVNVRFGDEPYARACFVQIVRNFFGGTLSVGVECYTLKEACNIGSDNGVYVVRWNSPDYEVDRYNYGMEKFTADAVQMERSRVNESQYWKRMPSIFDDLRDKNGSHFKRD